MSNGKFGRCKQRVKVSFLYFVISSERGRAAGGEHPDPGEDEDQDRPQGQGGPRVLLSRDDREGNQALVCVHFVNVLIVANVLTN